MTTNTRGPLCRKCNKMVDQVVVYDDIATSEFVVDAYCHGRRDTLRIAHIELVRMPTDVYRAFIGNPLDYLECFDAPLPQIEARK